MRNFSGKVAVVTGAAGGLGRAFAERFAREGMRVVLADADQGALERTVGELRQEGHDVKGVRADVSRLESVQKLARLALDAYGKIHVVCNNAGVDTYRHRPIWEATDKEWLWSFGVNFWGVVHGARTFMPIMLDQGEQAHMVNSASATGLVYGGSAYGMTKHAVVALTETIYGQLAERKTKVGVSVLCPGVVNPRLLEAERGRLAELQDTIQATAVLPGPQLRREMMQRLDSAPPPVKVADIVLQAIKDRQFYVRTDDIDSPRSPRHQPSMDRA